MHSMNQITKDRFIFFLAILGLLGYITYICVVRPDVPYMNTIRYITDYARLWSRNPIYLVRSWPDNQQSGLIDPLYVYLNIRYFSLNILLACCLTGFVVTAFFVTFALRATANIRLPEYILIPFIFALFLEAFSLNSWQLYTLDLGLPEYVRNFLYLAIILYADTLHTANRINYHAIFQYGGLLIVSVIMFGMGEVYSFCGSLAAISFLVYLTSKRSPDSQIAVSNAPIIAIGPLIALVVYYSLSQVFTHSFHHLLISAKLVELVPIALSTSFLSAEAARAIGFGQDARFVLGILLICAYIFGLVSACTRKAYALWFIPATLATYGFLVSISIAIARGDGGASAVGASRYYDNFLFFGVGVIWLIWLLLPENPFARRRLGLYVFATVISICVVTQAISLAVECRIAPYRAVAFLKMRNVFLHSSNPVTPQEARLLQVQSKRDAAYALSFAAKNGLGPFYGR